MVNSNQTQINDNQNNCEIAYQNNSYSCAGRGCKNNGEKYLKIIYINRMGWFCDYCSTELEKDSLVEKVVELMKYR